MPIKPRNPLNVRSTELGAALTNHDHVEADITDLAHLTEEQVEDFVGGMLTGNTETLITVTYQDADGTVDFVVDADLGNYTNTPGWIADITGSPLSELQDVTITAIASGEIIKWNGTAWINQTLAEAGIAADTHTHELDELDATGITSGQILSADGANGATWTDAPQGAAFSELMLIGA